MSAVQPENRPIIDAAEQACCQQQPEQFDAFEPQTIAQLNAITPRDSAELISGGATLPIVRSHGPTAGGRSPCSALAMSSRPIAAARQPAVHGALDRFAAEQISRADSQRRGQSAQR
jgi:hypothetical protein